MMTGVLAAAIAAGFLLPSLGAVPDPCQLVTTAQVTSALGSAPTRGKPRGPMVDEETGAKVSVCTVAAGKALTMMRPPVRTPLRAAERAGAAGLRQLARRHECHAVFYRGHLLYFSFVTLTSVGYGDLVPLHPIARSLATLEGVIGQLFPATLLARLVSLERQGRRPFS